MHVYESLPLDWKNGCRGWIDKNGCRGWKDALVPEMATWGAGVIRPDLAAGDADGPILLLTVFDVGLNIIFCVKSVNSFQIEH